jgi:hypothetical protein
MRYNNFSIISILYCISLLGFFFHCTLLLRLEALMLIGSPYPNFIAISVILITITVISKMLVNEGFSFLDRC